MPTLLQVENLSRSYGEKILFEHISFVINQFQKVALISKNGTGKTTLLNIIAGLEPSDEGTVSLFNNASVGYLMQEPVLFSENSVFDEVYATSNDIQRIILGYEKAISSHDNKQIQESIERMDAVNGWEYETRIKQILSRLKITGFDQKISGLSGGQRKRVALAKVLISEPEFLLLDEPTNHLDIEMIEWLEEYLLRSGITLFMVTHDRYFLDRICEDIIELDNNSLYRYKGNYSHFIAKQAERIGNQEKEVERARNLLRREQDWMDRMPKARTTKSKSRVESYYEIKSVAENRIREKSISIHIEGTRMGKKILELNDVTFNWGDIHILDHFSYIFKRNEKIGLVGNNGSGKSTLLEIITGALKPGKGSISTGETIRYGYYRQEGMTFNEETRLIDVVREIAETVKLADGEVVSAATFLNHFMFPYSSHYQPVYTLSGGEKRRLYLVTILMQNPNFLILDEPTNDLDIFTLTILEDYLATFKGCILVVTHDRYFLDKIVDHLFVFQGNAVIKDFPGNYSQYRTYLSHRKKTVQSIPNPVHRKEKNKSETPKKRSYKEERELETLEKEIEVLEAERASIEETLASGTLNSDQLTVHSIRLGEVLEETEIKTLRWIELSE